MKIFNLLIDGVQHEFFVRLHTVNRLSGKPGISWWDPLEFGQERGIFTQLTQ